MTEKQPNRSTSEVTYTRAWLELNQIIHPHATLKTSTVRPATTDKELLAMVNRVVIFVNALKMEREEISKVLAEALGYAKGIPGSPEQYAIGDHTPVTLADEAADKLGFIKAVQRKD